MHIKFNIPQGNNVLFLDDNPHRTKKFVSHYLWAKTVETSEDCIKELGINEYHVLFLDHDLGGEQFVDSGREDTGMEVVRWMVENKPNVGDVIVHSHNTPAGIEMVAKLEDAGYSAVYIPFIELFSDYYGI